MWKSSILLLLCALIINVTPSDASNKIVEESSVGYLGMDYLSDLMSLCLLEATHTLNNEEMVDFVGFTLNQIIQSEYDQLNKILFVNVLRAQKIAFSLVELNVIIDTMYQGFVSAVGEEYQFTEITAHAQSERKDVGLNDILSSAVQEIDDSNERNIVELIVDIMLDSDDERFIQIIDQIIKSSDNDELVVQCLSDVLKDVFIEPFEVEHDNDSHVETIHWTIRFAPRVWKNIWGFVIVCWFSCLVMCYMHVRGQNQGKRKESVVLNTTLSEDGEN